MRLAEQAALVLAAGLLVLAMALAVLVCTSSLVGCTDPRHPLAEAGFLAQHLKCVDEFNTREAIDQCRREVNHQWGIEETIAKDAGVQDAR